VSGVEHFRFANMTLSLTELLATNNNSPTGIAIDYASVLENVINGTAVGTLSATDPDEGDTLTFTLVDDAGGRFAIQGHKLVVRDGGRLDFEQAQFHQVKVRVTDTGNLSFEKTVTIAVADVDETPPVVTPPVVTPPVVTPPENLKLSGNNSQDNLTGGDGNDQLWGKAGNDVLFGGLGQDVFVFDTKLNSRTNKDKITDFSVADDSIWLDNKIFKKLGKKGSESSPAKLNKKFFKVGDKAKDGNDYVLYNKNKGVLLYDEDGNGAKAAVTIATLDKKLKLTAGDFLVI
jgi:Ca2+-binding RTX toxin-like protein